MSKVFSTSVAEDITMRPGENPRRVMSVVIRTQRRERVVISTTFSAGFIGSPEERSSLLARLLVDGAPVRASKFIGSPEEFEGVTDPPGVAAPEASAIIGILHEAEVGVPGLLAPGDHTIELELELVGALELRLFAASRPGEHHGVLVCQVVSTDQ